MVNMPPPQQQGPAVPLASSGAGGGGVSAAVQAAINAAVQQALTDPAVLSALIKAMKNTAQAHQAQGPGRKLAGTVSSAAGSVVPASGSTPAYAIVSLGGAATPVKCTVAEYLAPDLQPSAEVWVEPINGSSTDLLIVGIRAYTGQHHADQATSASSVPASGVQPGSLPAGQYTFSSPNTNGTPITAELTGSAAGDLLWLLIAGGAHGWHVGIGSGGDLYFYNTDTSHTLLDLLTSGAAVLRAQPTLAAGIQQSGQLGVEQSNSNGSGTMGSGKDFPMACTNTPTGVTLSTRVSAGIGTPAARQFTKTGFEFVVPVTGTGDTYYYGTWTTVGN